MKIHAMMRSPVKEPCYILVGCLVFFTSLSFFSTTADGVSAYDFFADVRRGKPKPMLALVDTSTTRKEHKQSGRTNAAVEENKGLEHFFMCLDSLGKTKKKIRIAHFGDSMIEGDLITSTLREEFQKEFGGSGVGFVLASPSNPSFRQSLGQSFSENWETVNVKDHKKTQDIGIAGYTSFTQGSSWLKFKSKEQTDLLKLFYGHAASDSALVMELNSLKHRLPTTKMLNEFVQRIDATDIALSFASSASIPVYGLSLESDSGIIIDNFSFRGSPGTYFKECPEQLLAQFREYLHYDLIIFQYGINVANNKNTDYSWYERQMLANLRYMRAAFPDADFLMIGCSDRAVKTKGEYATLKGIGPLIDTQKKLARQTGSGFLNLYELMGGNGSMKAWVNADTSLANKDYTHFNHRGAAKAGKLIYGAIMTDYNNRKKKHEAI